MNAASIAQTRYRAATEAVPAQVGRNYTLTRAEQETTIRWDRAEPIVHVWSASPVTWRKMARLGIAPVRTATSYGTVTGQWYRIPLERFRWGLKARRPAGRSPRRLQTPPVERGSTPEGREADHTGPA